MGDANTVSVLVLILVFGVVIFLIARNMSSKKSSGESGLKTSLDLDEKSEEKEHIRAEEKKYKESEEKKEKPEVKEEHEESSGLKMTKEFVPEKNETPSEPEKQTSGKIIYRYRPMTNVWVCRNCETENLKTDNRCRVCRMPGR